MASPHPLSKPARVLLNKPVIQGCKSIWQKHAAGAAPARERRKGLKHYEHKDPEPSRDSSDSWFPGS